MDKAPVEVLELELELLLDVELDELDLELLLDTELDELDMELLLDTELDELDLELLLDTELDELDLELLLDTELDELELLLEPVTVTTMLNAGSDADAFPSLTEMTILLKVPTALTGGLPLRLPVEELKLAQLGLLTMLKVSVSRFASLATGVKP